MLKLIVTDWNRSIFEDYYEETFLKFLFQTVIGNNLLRFDFIGLFKIFFNQFKIKKLFKRIKNDYKNRLVYVEEIINILNQKILKNLTVTLLKDCTLKYALYSGRKLDKKILDPIYKMKNQYGIKIGIISSGYKDGIKNILEKNGYSFDFIVANEIVIESSEIQKFEFKVLYNKFEILSNILTKENMTLNDVLFIGDDELDKVCLENVRYPVISFLADSKIKDQLNNKNFYLPKSQSDFQLFLEGCINS